MDSDQKIIESPLVEEKTFEGDKTNLHKSDDIKQDMYLLKNHITREDIIKNEEIYEEITCEEFYDVIKVQRDVMVVETKK